MVIIHKLVCVLAFVLFVVCGMILAFGACEYIGLLVSKKPAVALQADEPLELIGSPGDKLAFKLTGYSLVGKWASPTGLRLVLEV